MIETADREIRVGAVLSVEKFWRKVSKNSNERIGLFALSFYINISLYLPRKYLDTSLHLAWKYALRALSVPRSERFSERKSVSFEEQIMSKTKYPSIISRHMEAIMFGDQTMTYHLKITLIYEITWSVVDKRFLADDQRWGNSACTPYCLYYPTKIWPKLVMHSYLIAPPRNLGRAISLVIRIKKQIKDNILQ